LRAAAGRWAAGLLAVIVLALFWPAACSTDPEPSLRACLKGSEALYARYEGPDPDNCGSDAGCVASGCSGEVCSAESVATTCEVIPTPRGDYGCEACACLSGHCRWVRGTP
jgi:eight-cysteine-cluster-containing protein